ALAPPPPTFPLFPYTTLFRSPCLPLTLPRVGHVEDFHLQVSAPCRAHKKTPAAFAAAGVLVIKCLAVTYSRVGKPTLPSALDVFTSEFWMGSGGSRPLWPPGKPVCAASTRCVDLRVNLE